MPQNLNRDVAKRTTGGYVGNCRLCGTHKPLRNSHIIPEFIYQPMYDEKHRFFELHKRRALGAKRFQKGLRERILCDDCEHLLSRWEKYAAHVMSGKSSVTLRPSHERVWISGIDYTQFKLFLLSILWRASVTSQEFFKLVSLGYHENIIKNMLLEERPGRPEEYGCILIFNRLQGEDITDTMFNPEPLRWMGRRFSKLYFAGACWCFYCDSQFPTKHLRRLFLQEDGTLMALKMDMQDAQDLAGTARAIARKRGFI